MTSLSERIKKLRKEKKQTQKQMAGVLGITERHFQRYEAGEIDLPTSVTVKLADYFNVSTDYLIGRSDNPGRY